MSDSIANIQNVSDFLKYATADSGGAPTNPPLTQTASSHAITIKDDRGHKIGRIQSWGPTMSRSIDTIRELDSNTTGEPIEKVPQIISASSISIDRYELYTAHMAEAFHTPHIGPNTDLDSLAKQIGPLNVREIWRDPYNNIQAYVYVGCWFASWGITISATDDRIIKARATLEFTRRLKLN